MSNDTPLLTSSDIFYTVKLMGWGNITGAGFQETVPGDPSTIVPEPSSIALVVLALGMLVGIALRSNVD